MAQSSKSVIQASTTAAINSASATSFASSAAAHSLLELVGVFMKPFGYVVHL